MTFRDITIDDYDKLVSFWKINYFVGEIDDAQRFKLFLEKNPQLSILAEENGDIIGTALGSFDGRRGYIQKLVVDKGFRKQGLGQQLVEKVLEKLKTLGVTYIPISVEKDLIHFYEQCGFKKTDQIPMNINL